MADLTTFRSPTVSPDDQVDDIYSKDKADNELETGSDGIDDDRRFSERTLIWYAGTVFPLSAACFGPMASAFNICALAEEWRVLIPPAGTEAQETAIADPSWYFPRCSCLHNTNDP